MARLGLVALKAARTKANVLALLAGRSEDIQAARAAGSTGLVAELFSYDDWVRGEVPDQAYFERVRRALAPADQEAVVGEFMLLSERLLAEGKAKGRVEGRVEEARELLSRQIRRRFPAVDAELLTRLEGASLQDLERWAEQVVVAGTPDEVFAGPS